MKKISSREILFTSLFMEDLTRSVNDAHRLNCDQSIKEIKRTFIQAIGKYTVRYFATLCITTDNSHFDRYCELIYLSLNSRSLLSFENIDTRNLFSLSEIKKLVQEIFYNLNQFSKDHNLVIFGDNCYGVRKIINRRTYSSKKKKQIHREYEINILGEPLYLINLGEHKNFISTGEMKHGNGGNI